MLYTIYVDSLYGNNSNTGELTSPVKTLLHAFSQVYEGGNIILQTGVGTSYGNFTITKNVTIKAAYGASPNIGTINISGAQVIVEGLSFENSDTGIAVYNSNIGSAIIRSCIFSNVVTPVYIDSVNYIAIHRNYFTAFQSAVVINSALEVCISSNTFSNGMRSVQVATIGRLDLWGNTIYGALSLPNITNPDRNLRIIYKTLTDFEINYKRIQLPGYATKASVGYDIALNVVNGPSYNYGVDFIVISSGSLVSWDGYRLSDELMVGDILRIMYSEAGDVNPGDSIRLQNIGDINSRIDSNSISGSTGSISIGVNIDTPVKIHNNNFDAVTNWWIGVVPTGEPGIGNTGINNIGVPAKYVAPLNEDFRLQSSSPNINSRDANRWLNIYTEIGIIKGGGSYTASYTGIRNNVSPFDRDIDFSMFHRGVTGIQGVTGDIGSFEYNYNETSMGNYVAELGSDIAYPGTATGPYASIDRGYKRSGTKDLHIATNTVPYQNVESLTYAYPNSGSSYSRFRSKDIVLSGSDLIIGDRNKSDAAIFYSSHPSLSETGLIYVSPDGNDSWTGSISSPYRTIKRALQNGGHYIFVEPGYYPSFKGVTGIHILGTDRVKEIGLSGIFYSNTRDSSWTGVGSYSINKNSIIMTAPATVEGTIIFSSDVDLKMFATVKSSYLMLKLFNTDNNVYVKISRSLSVITYGYTTGGVTYEINYITGAMHTLDELFSNLKIRIIIKNNYFSIYIDGEYIQGDYTNSFSSGSVTNWKIQLVNNGYGEDIVSNLNVFSSHITGATGVSEVFTLKKLFAITGATGIHE
jgi:hypothetical protein